MASWRATYRHILPDAFLEGLSVSRLAPQWHALLPREQLALVAAHGERVVGFATGGGERASAAGAELFMIYVHPGYLRLGIGRRLLSEAAARFRQKGHRKMMLWVVTNNYPARAFYRAMGARPADERTERFAGTCVPQIAYRWKDLERLGE